MSERDSSRLMIVGGQRVIEAGDEEAVLHFYGDLFARLTKEVMHTGDRTRYIGFQCPHGDTGSLLFFGIEVGRIVHIPSGMVAWDMDETSVTVWESRDGGDSSVSKADIAWRWWHRLHGGYGGLVGEFTLAGPALLGDMHIAGTREFRLSAHAGVVPGATENSVDDVLLVDYDPAWSDRFAEMATYLRDSLGPDVARRVEHYGSTSIPGIPSKPVIDILVEVPSYEAAIQRAFERLVSEEWEYWLYTDHMIFIKREKLMGVRTHHVHMAPRGHRLWEGIAFRDYLRAHPGDAERYTALKRDLAEKFHNDRERYTIAKTAFVSEITNRALGKD